MRWRWLIVAMAAWASGPPERVRSVSTVPGASALTRMSSGANSAAMERVNDMSAALAPAYMAIRLVNMKAPTESTLTIAAHGLAVRWGRAASTRNTGPFRLTAKDLSHASLVSRPR